MSRLLLELFRCGQRVQQRALRDGDGRVRQVQGDGRRRGNQPGELSAVPRHRHGNRQHGTLHDEVDLQVSA